MIGEDEEGLRGAANTRNVTDRQTEIRADRSRDRWQKLISKEETFTHTHTWLHTHLHTDYCRYTVPTDEHKCGLITTTHTHNVTHTISHTHTTASITL